MPHPPSQVDARELIRLFDQGLSFTQIARQMNVSPGSVAGMVRRLGLKRPGQSNYKDTPVAVRKKRPQTKAEMIEDLRQAVLNTPAPEED